MNGLPPGWESATLEELTDPRRPICYGILMPKDHVEDGVPYVKVKDFSRGPLDVATLRRTAPEIAQKYRRSSLVGGDVLVSIRGTYGRVVIAPESLTGGNITQDTARIAPTSALDRDYLAWFLQSPDAQGYFRRVARGVAVKGVNIGDLKQLAVPLAPQEEQARVVAAIEEHLSHLDAAEVSLISATSRLVRFEDLVYQQALLPSAPQSLLGHVVNTASGGTPKRERPELFGGPIPWIKSGELGDGTVTRTAETITDLALEESSAKLVPKGTVLIAMYGATIGKLGRVGVPVAATNQAVAALFPSEQIDSAYLWNVLRALRTELVRLGKGGAQPNISQSILRELTIPVPSIVEQKAANARIQQSIDALNQARNVCAAAARRSVSLRRAVLAAAFSGKLVRQQPADEPASALLERIRAERSAAAAGKRKQKVKTS